MKRPLTIGLLGLAVLSSAAVQADEMGYEAYVDSPKRIKCLYGYVTAKTGNFDAARAIFEDCVARWNDVYSLISLAQMYESGNGVEKDLNKSAALLKQGAEQPDKASYVSLARYHWGVALAEGRGVEADPDAARTWLRRAAADGQPEADEYLQQLDHTHAPASNTQ
ncbi:SEL1-like repeat protein [Pseudomonas stutzeri]|uniref:Sel1 repeat family protein n=1 Tax=Stutzerimonas stutzeri TaxID=316 RepID=A0A2N8S0Q0_STUST|nr:SEL1-like repeat protein [Stutzerimonas stutzeri]MCQ4297311.1 SEL1-like repeat protein [Stutzerimonas stutzeri]PNF80204.1 sel1 repeat family protein [Stutzerimonas stutzeri]